MARYYADQTLKNHEVAQLHAPVRPGWFAPLVLPDYDGKALPLWRTELHPNFTVWKVHPGSSTCTAVPLCSFSVRGMK